MINLVIFLNFAYFKLRLCKIQTLLTICAPLAQLDRAFDCGSKGQRFESSRAYHFISKTPLNALLKTYNVKN